MFKQLFLIVLLGLALSVPVQATQGLYGPIGRQDTLWNIAVELRPSKKVTTQQVMMALYKKNQHAFTVNNISSLRKGAHLIAPTLGEAKQFSRNTAVKMVQRHNTRWKKRRYVKINAPIPEEIKQKLSGDTTQSKEATTSTNAVNKGGTALPPAPQGQLVTTSGESPQKQLAILKQELVKTRQENQLLNQELASLKQQKSQTHSNAETNSAIQVQLDALRHELEELRTILSQKDNHIKVLQASLKDASKAIKSQHADNMRLYNKLKELSPESVVASQNNGAENVQPQLELAAVTKSVKASGKADDSGIAKVWADEVPGEKNNAVQGKMPKASQATNGVKSDGGITLNQILSKQTDGQVALLKPLTTEFTTSRRAAVSPIAWAAVLISFVFILFLIFRALLTQNDLRRFEEEDGLLSSKS